MADTTEQHFDVNTAVNKALCALHEAAKREGLDLSKTLARPREALTSEQLVTTAASLRAGRRVLRRAMVFGRTPHGAVSGALTALCGNIKATRHARGVLLDCGLAHKRYASLTQLRGRLVNKDRGALGIGILRAEGLSFVAPSDMIAANESFKSVIAGLLESEANLARAIEDGTAELVTFRCLSAWAPIDDAQPGKTGAGFADLRFTGLRRGAVVPELTSPAKTLVDDLTTGMITWMHTNCRADGRMLYKYWPSRNQESTALNTIREWMATLCLGRIAHHTGQAEHRRIFLGNLFHNLKRDYREETGLGLIVEKDKVKLGAVALAAGAVRLAGADAPEGVLQRLHALIHHQWRETGAFRTFYAPAARNDCQNFYPGEALWFWAQCLGDDHTITDKFLKSFTHYREFFRRDANPAFVPWHTGAYVRFLEHTWHEEMAAFVFEMNDWLLGLQRWQDAPGRPFRGRFYDPERPHFGKPHASATGVYLEGLIDAFTLARRLGDEERAHTYRRAILRGAFNLHALQFKDSAELYYVDAPQRVLGGIKTEMYDNEIRVDNVQHGLMALLKVARTFKTADYKAGWT